jgi:hypothetical protein
MSVNQRPKALPATEALIQQVIAEASCDLPQQGKEFTHYDSAFACVQRFAFANGFAVVETQVSPKWNYVSSIPNLELSQASKLIKFILQFSMM